MLKSKLLSATAAAPEPVFIEDVFSTWLYTGTGSTQTITNGIDLAGEGGLVWIKRRDSAAGHYFIDTERGDNKYILSNSTTAELSFQVDKDFGSFLSDGFSLLPNFVSGVNNSGNSLASWTFRKAPRFFDVVTYTGNGVAGRTVPHNLGVAPGCIIIKSTDSSFNWYVYHLSTGNTKAFYLNTTDIGITSTLLFNNTSPTSTEFTLGSGTGLNGSGGTYVAYLFAHDPLGPSGDGSDGLIACGSYTGNGSTNGPEINLGWEPQWVLYKNTTQASSWLISNNMTGLNANSSTAVLFPNSNIAESGSGFMNPTPTGFKLNATTNTSHNVSGNTYIYIAIRRGPMRQPESGTEVFAVDSWSSGVPSWTSGFPVDYGITKSTASSSWFHSDRLRGAVYLMSNSTDAETSNSFAKFDIQNGWGDLGADSSYKSWMFRRAPGFFDVVAYTGDGTFDGSYNVSHSLGVTPEMIITKSRSASDYWSTYHSGLTSDTYQVQLNLTSAQLNTGQSWGPSSTSFKPQYAGNTNYSANVSGRTYIAYLFATLAGVSKVGSYTGNGSSQTINCGFTGGARFVLIKRTDSTGDWYVWDTARGIVSGNDPHLSLNTTAAEVTSDDTIDPDSSGFIVNQVSATNVNVSSASYIYLAIA